MIFSVLMSLYDKEKPDRLDRCLLSLSKQTFLADEIVIVLDGPVNPFLASVLDKWRFLLPIIEIKLAKNVGLGNALNIGLSHCKNNIVFRMDTDDVCYAYRFEKQLSYLSKKPDVALLGGYISEFSGSEDNILGVRAVPLLHNEIVKYSCKKNPFNHMSVVFRKDIIEKVGGYKHHHFMEDYNLWLRVISGGYQVANIPDILVNVSAGHEMISRRRGFKYIKSEWKLAMLKSSLGIQPYVSSFMIFVMRSVVRLLPTKLLSYVYKESRKDGNS
ncbi:glycosyltransferase [Yersinia sp. J1]